MGQFLCEMKEATQELKPQAVNTVQVFIVVTCKKEILSLAGQRRKPGTCKYNKCEANFATGRWFPLLGVLISRLQHWRRDWEDWEPSASTDPWVPPVLLCRHRRTMHQLSDELQLTCGLITILTTAPCAPRVWGCRSHSLPGRSSSTCPGSIPVPSGRQKTAVTCHRCTMWHFHRQ